MKSERTSECPLCGRPIKHPRRRGKPRLTHQHCRVLWEDLQRLTRSLPTWVEACRRTGAEPTPAAVRMLRGELWRHANELNYLRTQTGESDD